MSYKSASEGQDLVQSTHPHTILKTFQLPLEVYSNIIKHLHRDKALRTLASFLQVSHHIYDLASPILYKKITLDNSFLIHFFDLVPENGIWALPRRRVNHKQYVDADYPTRRLVESEVSLNSKWIRVDDRQSALLALTETVEIPERIDSEVCTRFQTYLKEIKTPFSKVTKAVFGPVILYELGLYRRLPAHFLDTPRHPSIIMLVQLIRPTEVCAYLEPPDEEWTWPLVQPFIYSRVARMSWSDVCDSSVSPIEGEEGIADGMERISEDFEEDIGMDAWRCGLDALREFKSVEKVILHDTKYPLCSKGRINDTGKEFIVICPATASEGEAYPHDSARRGYRVARSVIRNLLGDEERATHKSITVIGLDQLMMKRIGGTDSVEQSEEEKAERVENLRTHTKEAAETLGYKFEDIHFKDNLDAGGCTCCGLQDKDAVHELVGCAKWREW